MTLFKVDASSLVNVGVITGENYLLKSKFLDMLKNLNKAFFQSPFTSIEVFSLTSVGIGSGPKLPSCKCGKFAVHSNSTVFKSMCIYKSYTPLFKL